MSGGLMPRGLGECPVGDCPVGSSSYDPIKDNLHNI